VTVEEMPDPPQRRFMGRGVDRGGIGGDGVAGTGTVTGTVTGASTVTVTVTSTVTGTGTVTVGSIRLWVISHFRRLFSPSLTGSFHRHSGGRFTVTLAGCFHCHSGGNRSPESLIDSARNRTTYRRRAESPS